MFIISLLIKKNGLFTNQQQMLIIRLQIYDISINKTKKITRKSVFPVILSKTSNSLLYCEYLFLLGGKYFVDFLQELVVKFLDFLLAVFLGVLRHTLFHCFL